MLVTKLSNGKYRNEGALFSEPISDDNVKLMGEMIALQVLRTAKAFDYEVSDNLYRQLLGDVQHMGESKYIISDVYDYAQLAICFLLQYRGRYASENCIKDRRGNLISIKKACYRKIDSILGIYRRNTSKDKQIEFNHKKYEIADPRDCFDTDEANYDKADALLQSLHLSEGELDMLNCSMSGMTQSQAAALLGITIYGVQHRKMRIRKKYNTYIGAS